jgi:hypothetical protein
MLRNPIYRGERIWNKSYWVKDHETGKRRRFERPESEWVQQQEESWRIVSDELWHAAQATRGRRNQRHQRDDRGRIRRTAVGGSSTRKRLLSGFLECGECGGSFHELSGRAKWGCSWHRNRGNCTASTLIPQAQLERAVLKAVRGALNEQVVEHALRVALDDLRSRIEAVEPVRLEAELAALDRKIERALDLAIELGDLDTAKEKLRALRGEREGIARNLASVRIDLPAVEDLMPQMREKFRDIETTLKADIVGGRLASGGLLGNERLRAYQDGRIEGTALLEPEDTTAPRRTSGPAVSVVAEARYARDSTLPVPLRLPVEGRVGAQAASQ